MKQSTEPTLEQLLKQLAKTVGIIVGLLVVGIAFYELGGRVMSKIADKLPEIEPSNYIEEAREAGAWQSRY